MTTPLPAASLPTDGSAAGGSAAVSAGSAVPSVVGTAGGSEGVQLFTASGVDLLHGPGAWVPAASEDEQAKRDAANETVLGEFAVLLACLGVHVLVTWLVCDDGASFD